MNILLISPLPPPSGGMATWTKLYINSKYAKQNNIQVVNNSIIGERAKNFTKKKLKDEITRTFNVYRDIKNYLGEYEFDLVHMNSSCSRIGILKDFLYALLIKKNKKCLILHFHCDTSVMIRNILSKKVFQKLCHLSDMILCLNKSSKQHIKSITGRDSVVVSNFMDMPEVDNYSEKYISHHIETIVFVGHIIKAKGCDTIIEVAKSFPDINFKLIGIVSDEFINVKHSNNVQLLGEISKERVMNELNKADLLLFPSHSEGFPYVVLEAMACGLPIIATPVGAIPEMVEDKGGILVDISDTEGFKNAINYLDNYELRKGFSLWNKKKYLDHYTVEKVISHIFDLYTAL